jgi:hypothetical protein
VDYHQHNLKKALLAKEEARLEKEKNQNKRQDKGEEEVAKRKAQLEKANWDEVKKNLHPMGYINAI